MQNNNQYWETNEQLAEDSNILMLESTANETLVLIRKNAPKKKGGDLGDGDDPSKNKNPKENIEIDEDNQRDEDNQSDTIKIDEDYPGPKEDDIDQAEKPGINGGEKEDNE